MAQISLQHVSFSYPLHQDEEHGGVGNPEQLAMDKPVLEDINFEIEAGSFCIITGKTGCGKSTLLRLLKTELTPFGGISGTICIEDAVLVHDGKRNYDIDPSTSAALSGFVMQDPDMQLVTDKVWHELAFGMENLGLEANLMRRRVAEVAHFFALEPIVHHDTASLSGGQKQLVNLAAALALRPKILLLDEPTAQLDPHARRQFISMLAAVNKELGITVVMATHAPDEVEEFTTQHIELSPLSPLGTQVVWSHNKKIFIPREEIAISKPTRQETALELHDVYVRYDRESAWVLRSLDMHVKKGSIHALVGGNGSGKSTALATMAGLLKTQRSRVQRSDGLSHIYLPQDPKVLFVSDTVWQELHEWQKYCTYTSAEVEDMMQLFQLQDLRDYHPYDISGGQQQRLALAKVLLTGKNLLLLDEPTKGLDPASTAHMVNILRKIASLGTTIVVATHDLDVVHVLADEATLLFDGQAACSEPIPEFFEHNLIYTAHEKSRLFTDLLPHEEQ
ncbi:MAG: ATP-binding cassette domain-containing protein [Eggerthellaceae bacterium]|nr:ATP-binding cassette domain-containing protein [Eggerthellaceae bacterium]